MPAVVGRRGHNVDRVDWVRDAAGTRTVVSYTARYRMSDQPKNVKSDSPKRETDVELRVTGDGILSLRRVEDGTGDGPIDCVDVRLRELREARARVEERDVLVLAGNGLAVDVQAVHEHEPCIRRERRQLRRIQDGAEVRVRFAEREDTSARQACDLRTRQFECHELREGLVRSEHLFDSIRSVSL